MKKISMAIFMAVMVFAFLYPRVVSARGETMPPPWGAGVGSAGDWLGSGPIFGFDDGPDGGIGGGPGGGRGGSWFEGGPWGPRRGGWGGGSGGRGNQLGNGDEFGGGGGNTGDGGYDTDCYRAKIVTGGPAPCEPVCHCALYWYSNEKPPKDTWATGICEAADGNTTVAECLHMEDACPAYVFW